jgi:hypothetical protein
MSVTRLPNETFEEYKERRKLEQKAIDNRIERGPILNDEPHRLCEQYGLSPSGYVEMLASATKEYKAARDSGLIDAEILDALKSGTLGQQIYAKFLENEVIGKVKYD